MVIFPECLVTDSLRAAHSNQKNSVNPSSDRGDRGHI